MDILSLTQKPSVSVGALGRPVRSNAETPSPHVSGVDPTDKAPPGSNATETESQKEAPQVGLKTPETLLDLLTQTTNGKSEADASFLLGQNGLAEKLGEVKLPPTAESLLAALSALGVTLPPAVVSDNAWTGVPAKLVQAIQQTPGLPQPAKVALVQLLHDAFVQPLPASSLIGLGRPVESVAPTGTPAVFVSNDPLPNPVAGAVPVATNTPGNGLIESNTPPVKVDGQSLDTTLVQGLNVTSIITSSAGSGDEVWPADGNVPAPRLVAPDPVMPKPHEGPMPGVGPKGTVLGIPDPVLETPQPTMTPGSNLLAGVDATEVPVPVNGAVPVASLETKNGTTVPLPRLTAGDDTVTGATPVPAAGLGRPQPVPKPVENVVPVRDNANGITTTMEPKPTATGSQMKAPEPTIVPLPHMEGEVVPAIVPTRTSTPPSGVTNGIEPGDNSIDLDTTTDDTSVVPAGRQVTVVPNPVDTTGKGLPVESMKKVTSQIADRIETMVFAKKSGNVTIHLRPEEFGSVTLTVRSFGNRVDATVKASNDDVRAALQLHRQDLVQNVESRGLSLSSFQVGHETAGSQNGHGQQAMRAEADRNAQLRLATSNRPVATTTTTSWLSSRSTGVDYLA